MDASSENWVTLCNHPNASLAQLDATLLRKHGIVVLLPEAETSSNLWHLTAAVGGVRVLVPEHEVARARDILGMAGNNDGMSEESTDAAIGDSWRKDGALSGADARWAAEASARYANSANVPSPSQPTLGDRLLRASFAGCFFPPFHFYAVVLALTSFDKAVQDGAPDPGWRRVVALAIALPSVLLQLWMLAMLWR